MLVHLWAAVEFYFNEFVIVQWLEIWSLAVDVEILWIVAEILRQVLLSLIEKYKFCPEKKNYNFHFLIKKFIRSRVKKLKTKNLLWIKTK